jgi:hypothetical protein
MGFQGDSVGGEDSQEDHCRLHLVLTRLIEMCSLLDEIFRTHILIAILHYERNPLAGYSPLTFACPSNSNSLARAILCSSK